MINNVTISLCVLSLYCAMINTSCGAFLDGQMQGLTSQFSGNCSHALANQHLTIDDILTSIMQRWGKISGDLQAAGHIAKKIGVRLINYVKANPADASIIAGSIVGLYIITSALIRSMTATRCPCCLRSHHEANNLCADYR